MRLLIDGDILLYKIGFAVQHKISDEEVELEPFSHATYLMRRLVNKLLKTCANCDYNLVISGSNNFRYEVAKTQPYKGNRSDTDKPLYYIRLKKYLESHYKDNLLVAEGEADDLLGSLSSADPNNIIVATIDKDLMMIPGINLNIDKLVFTYISDPGKLWMETTTSNKKVLRGYGFKWFCAQMPLGDTADHIPGISGVGPVKTLTILDKCTTIRNMWSTVIRTYRKHRVINRMDEIRQLLWIHRNKSFEETIKK